MSPADRARFDRLVDEVLESLPPGIVELFDEKPLVVEDHPSADMLREFGLDATQSDEICGLHSGPMGEMRQLDGGHDGSPVDEIGVIHLFREGVVACAGGWEPWEERLDGDGVATGGGVELISDEIAITILHEVGHHFGLDEEDLDRLGYG